MSNAAKPTITLRAATSDDTSTVLWFVKQLAIYEKAPESVEATESLLRQNLFGAHPYAHVILAFDNDTPVGFALYFFNFSTWTGRPGLYLEDLFVVSEYRGQGIGKQLLAELARIATSRECGRMEWVVLDWNEPSIEFYKSLGAKQMKEWIINRVSGKSLDDLANM